MKKYGFKEDDQVSIYDFGELKRCPKCGTDFYINEPGVEYAPAFLDHNDPFRELTIPERLDLTCAKCGYQFIMACYDTKEEPQ